ncbi:MAG: solute carrier family 23 protein [Aestuariivirga sp.]|uniref:solute carrier family 23 protein n=1 Tax=Aestuariivirga sp. TaxID=2650926 RepID=UPI0030170DA0
MKRMAMAEGAAVKRLGWAIYVPAVLQHFGLGAVTLVIPRLIAQAAGLDGTDVESYCQIAMIAVGIATLLQAWGWRGIGSGYLLPACFTGIYVAPALAVASAHGLGAVAGLTIIAGATQLVLSRILRQVRGFIPADVIGVTVLMIGLGWGILGLKLICGVSAGQVAAPLEWLAAAVALAAMVSLSVWGGKVWRRVAVLVGLCAGCLAALLLYLMLGTEALAMPRFMLAVPQWPLVPISFTGSYLPGFMIGAVASFLRVAGDVVASHQVSDQNWKRPNTKSISAGGVAEGLGNIIAGLLGSMPINSNSGSVGLVAASGVSSPNVARGVGVMWIVLGLLPFGPPLLLLIPASVQGAAVFFTAGFVMRAGFNMLTQRMIDNRRGITIGSALIVGLAFDEIIHALMLPMVVKTVFSSALITSVAVAIILTALFRIGVKRKVATVWEPAQGDEVLRSWVETNARMWGARMELVAKAEAVVEEFAQAMDVLARGPVEAVAQYDETALRLDFTWAGDALPGASSSRVDTGHSAAEAALRLAAMMIRHQGRTTLPSHALPRVVSA